MIEISVKLNTRLSRNIILTAKGGSLGMPFIFITEDL